MKSRLRQKIIFFFEQNRKFHDLLWIDNSYLSNGKEFIAESNHIKWQVFVE